MDRRVSIQLKIARPSDGHKDPKDETDSAPESSAIWGYMAVLFLSIALFWRWQSEICLKRLLHYGAVGIKVCEEWENDYQSFKTWAYENGYDENAEIMKCTIDRIDPNGNYEPSNCRWVDMFVQNDPTHKRSVIECI